MSKLIIFDLEAKVDFIQIGKTQRMDGKNSYIMCMNWYELDLDKPKYKIKKSDVKSIAIQNTKAFKKDFYDDSEVVAKIFDVLTADDVVGWVGHNIKAFDIPLINVRLQAHNKQILPYMSAIDDTLSIFKSAKGKLGLVSFKLDYLCEFYKLPRKGKVAEKTWTLARAGNVKALDEVQDYGKQDIVVSTALYEKASKLNGSKLILSSKFNGAACPVCGSKRIISRGHIVNSRGKQYRGQCQDCGKWVPGKFESWKEINAKLDQKDISTEESREAVGSVLKPSTARRNKGRRNGKNSRKTVH